MSWIHAYCRVLCTFYEHQLQIHTAIWTDFVNKVLIPFPVEQVERDRVHSHREQLGKRKGWRPKALNTSREPMLSYIIGGTTFLKTFWQYWLKLNVRRPNNSTPRCAPNRHAYVSSSQESIRMFTAALLVTALNT